MADVWRETVVADSRVRAAVSQIYREPQPLVRYYQNKLENSRKHFASFGWHRFFNYSIRIRESDDSNRWIPFDPKFSSFPSNDWNTLISILDAAGRNLFARPVVGVHWDTFELPERARLYQNVWSLDSKGSNDPMIVCSRKKLNSNDSVLQNIFEKLGDYDAKLEAIPKAVQADWLNRLAPCLSVSKCAYSAGRFVDDLANCLEQTALLHYYLFSRLISAIVKEPTCYNPQELISYHLVPCSAIDTSRERLFELVREAYPDFRPPEILEKTTLTRGEHRNRLEQLRENAVKKVSEQVQPVVAPQSETDSRLEPLVSLPFGEPELDRLLRLIKCELHFVRFRVSSGFSFASELNAEVASNIVQQVVPDLARTWTGIATAEEVEYDDFWLKKIWNVSADGRSQSTCSMTSFRYGLYDPPYGGASDWLIAEVEAALFELLFGTNAPEDCYRVFAVDTRTSKYFINDWWDYLWVAAHKERPEVLVIYGTATD